MFRLQRALRDRRWVVPVAFLAAIAVGLMGSGVAVGTPGSGVTAATVVARGTAVDKVKTRGDQPYDVVVQTITLAAGGTTGWHSHPGQAIVVVKSGTMTFYEGNDRTCTPLIVGAGQVFVDRGYGDVHIARNEGATPAELAVVFLDVPIGGPFRIDAADPGNCPF